MYATENLGAPFKRALETPLFLAGDVVNDAFNTAHS